VRDAHGEDLGKVDDLLVDAGEGKVRFIRVESGGVLGTGATPSFIAEAPHYDPEIVEPPQTGWTPGGRSACRSSSCDRHVAAEPSPHFPSTLVRTVS
jgi:hypothetical protein